MEDPVKERIRCVQEKYSKSQAEFARKLGVPKSTYNTMFKRGEKASFTILEAILSVFTDVSADWLLRGIGSMMLTPDVIITDGNKYMVERFEELINEKRDLEGIISEKDKIIERLSKEKKELIGYDVAAEPEAQLKTKK